MSNGIPALVDCRVISLLLGSIDISTLEKRQLFQMFNEDDPVLGYFEYKDGRYDC